MVTTGVQRVYCSQYCVVTRRTFVAYEYSLLIDSAVRFCNLIGPQESLRCVWVHVYLLK